MSKQLPDIEVVFQRAGGRKVVAGALNIKVPSTYDWKRVPPDRVAAMSKLTGMTPHELRPDIFPAEQGAA
jgi:DNA-binding transcriptional regulator YdaS (Cro superfamily)